MFPEFVKFGHLFLNYAEMWQRFRLDPAPLEFGGHSWKKIDFVHIIFYKRGTRIYRSTGNKK